METELVELFEQAKKAADLAVSDDVSSSGPEVSRCVDALKRLKAFPVTYDLLVSTQVGKKLRPFTKHCRVNIRSVASDLFEHWKKIVIEDARTKKNGTAASVKLECVRNESTVKVTCTDMVRSLEELKLSTRGRFPAMETVLLELFESAKKHADLAASDGVSSSSPVVLRCIDALEQLKGFPVTYDVLVSTQVGKKLRPLLKHRREKIQSVATDLLEQWKYIVVEETTARNKKKGYAATGRVENVGKESTYIVRSLEELKLSTDRYTAKETELLELFEYAEKYADLAAWDGFSSSGPEVSRCVDALEQLKGFPVTYDVLVSTRVGMKLRPLTKHHREKIKSLASEMLELWKKVVIKETAARNKKNGNAATVKVESVRKRAQI